MVGAAATERADGRTAHGVVLGDHPGTAAGPDRRRRASAAADGHARWAIENEGFNELVTRWHADHVYRHEPTALLVFTLLAMLCLNVFLTFYRRNLKPAARQATSRLHVARELTAALYSPGPAAPPRAPPGPRATSAHPARI